MIGVDKIKDFELGLDQLHIAEALYGGGLTASEVIDTYATEKSNRVVLNFGDGDVIVLLGVTTTEDLHQDVVLI